MKKIILPMLVLIAWATSLTAQITQEQADAIVLEHIQNEVTPPYLLYVNVNTPSEEGIAITTFQEEAMTAKYACWAYYLNENPDLSEPSLHRYLFVKENDGNLLEIITSNDLGPEELTEWKIVNPAGLIDEMQNHVKIYPSPATNQLKIENGELKIENVQIFDIDGRKLSTFNVQRSTIDISNLPSGVYFVKIQTEVGVVMQKIIKN